MKAGRVVSLPAIEKGYQEFVAWHNTTLERKEEQLCSYWEKQLAGELPVLKLPTDRPRPPVRRLKREAETFRLSDELSVRLRQLASDNQTTLYTTLLAAVQVLLARLSGQDDVVVGSPMTLRKERAFSQTVGLFTDLIPL